MHIHNYSKVLMVIIIKHCICTLKAFTNRTLSFHENYIGRHGLHFLPSTQLRYESGIYIHASCIPSNVTSISELVMTTAFSLVTSMDLIPGGSGLPTVNSLSFTCFSKADACLCTLT